MRKLFNFFSLLIVGLFFVSSAKALEAPFINQASYQGGGRVYLSWTQVPDADYQIVYGPAENPTAHGVALGRGTNYMVGYLFENTSYHFQVKAVRNGEVSGLSNHVKVWVGASGRSAAVADTTASKPATTHYKTAKYDNNLDTMRTSEGFNDPKISSGKPGIGHLNLRTSRGPKNGQVTLHWNQPMVHDAGEYNITYTDDPAMEKWGVLNLPGSSRSFTVGALTPGRRYWFRMSTTTTGNTGWVSDIAR